MMGRRAFTLVELLLVVFILAAVAASAATVVDQQDSQLRHDDTKARLGRIRIAILGRDDAPTPGGFAADAGDLPAAVSDLTATTTTWSSSGPFPAGRRGPYLPTLDPSFLDGWGHPFEREPVDLDGDGVPDPDACAFASWGASHVRDLAPPSDPYEADERVIIGRHAWMVDLLTWNVAFEIARASGGTVTNPRLKVHYLQRDGALAATAEVVGVPAAASPGVPVRFDFRSPGQELWVAAGVRALELTYTESATPATQHITLWPGVTLPPTLPTWTVP